MWCGGCGIGDRMGGGICRRKKIEGEGKKGGMKNEKKRSDDAMKARFRYIEHTSDVGFEAYGDTLEELFANAALATFSFMTNVDEIDEEEEREVHLNAEDLYSLMFDWIDEMLFFFESESIVFKKFHLKIDEGNFSLYGRCIGGKFHPEKHSSGIIIKAVTYNMMEIKRENGVWRARVVLDV